MMLPVPLSPLAEQAEVVRQVKRRLAAADRLAVTLNDQLEQAPALRQSLLREAFAGQLVPQNPKDEPASALLERILAAREAEAKKPKAKRMPKAKFKSKTVRCPLLDVLREYKKPMTPEELFNESGYQNEFNGSDEPQGVVDAFYAELRMLTDKPAKVLEEKDSKHKAFLRTIP